LHPTEKNIWRVGRRPEAADSAGVAVGEEEKGLGRTGAEEEGVGQRGAEEEAEGVARTGAEEEAEGVEWKGAKEAEGVGEEAAATRGAWPQTEINRGIETSKYDRLLIAANLYACVSFVKNCEPTVVFFMLEIYNSPIIWLCNVYLVLVHTKP
jgi:hypothetical protein